MNWGIAHALKKEVILLTAEAKDVPSDYRHLRYLQYNRMDVDWNQTLSQELQATLKQVLSRLSHSDKTIPSTAPRQSAVLNVPAEAEDNEETRSPEGKPRRQFPRPRPWACNCKPLPSGWTALGCRVLLTSQHASLCKLHAAIACLLNERSVRSPMTFLRATPFRCAAWTLEMLPHTRFLWTISMTPLCCPYTRSGSSSDT